MLSTDRKFHFTAELNIKKSKLLKSHISPKDDEVNWMFINLDNIKYSFVYKVENPANAQYNYPFEIKIAFTFYDLVENKLELERLYMVFRGEEEVGTIKLIKHIN